MELLWTFNLSTSYALERSFDRESKEKYTRLGDTLDINDVDASRKRPEKLEIRWGTSSERKYAAES